MERGEKNGGERLDGYGAFTEHRGKGKCVAIITQPGAVGTTQNGFRNESQSKRGEEAPIWRTRGITKGGQRNKFPGWKRDNKE